MPCEAVNSRERKDGRCEWALHLNKEKLLKMKGSSGSKLASVCRDHAPTREQVFKSFTNILLILPLIIPHNQTSDSAALLILVLNQLQPRLIAQSRAQIALFLFILHPKLLPESLPPGSIALLLLMLHPKLLPESLPPGSRVPESLHFDTF
jgi:hypothetical protein